MTQERKRNITVRFSESELERIKHVADDEIRPIANLIHRAVMAYITVREQSGGGTHDINERIKQGRTEPQVAHPQAHEAARRALQNRRREF